MVLVKVREGKMHRCNGKKYASDDPFEVTEAQYKAFQDKLKKVKEEAPSEPEEVAPEPVEEAVEEEPVEEEFPKHHGGKYYKLSNGETVAGKEAAQEAQAALDAE